MLDKILRHVETLFCVAFLLIVSYQLGKGSPIETAVSAVVGVLIVLAVGWVAYLEGIKKGTKIGNRHDPYDVGFKNCRFYSLDPNAVQRPGIRPKA